MTLSRLILEHLAEVGTGMVSSFFPAKYPEARLWRELLGLGDGYRFRRETFSALLSRLQSQGLVARSGPRWASTWRLTEKGALYLSDLSRRGKDGRLRTDGVHRLVAFDIPEKERSKRDAIRLELVAAGFTQLQKSVWYGERPLPSDFMELIDALNLSRHVHIFSVRERGTLR